MWLRLVYYRIINYCQGGLIFPNRTKREERLRRIGKSTISDSTCRTAMTCLVVRKGDVIATGVNKRGFRGSSIHAERDALRKLRWQKTGAEGADLWLFRFGGHGGDADRMSKPCADCMEAISAAGINRVFYYDWEGNLHRLKASQADPDEHYSINKWDDFVITT